MLPAAKARIRKSDRSKNGCAVRRSSHANSARRTIPPPIIAMTKGLLQPIVSRP